MVVKLNSYLLPNILIDKMKTKIEETKNKKIELGFDLCRTKTNILIAGDECTGTECVIEHKPKCIAGLHIGGYHTHPKGGSGPSIADLIGAYRNDVECVGSARDNDIKCYVRIGRKKPEDEQRIVMASKEIEEPMGPVAKTEEYQKWIKVRDDILNKHFMKIDVK